MSKQPKLLCDKAHHDDPPCELVVTDVLRDLLEDVIDEQKTTPELLKQHTIELPPNSRDTNLHDNSSDANISHQENPTSTALSTGICDSAREHTPQKNGRRKTRVKAKPRRASDSNTELSAKTREEDIQGMSKPPKIVIRGRANAKSFAAKATRPSEHMANRMVFYADGSSEDREGIQGVGVTYKCFPGEAKDLVWSDESYGIIGTHNIDTAEMLAIDCALKTAIREAPRYTSQLTATGSPTQSSKFGVMIFTDSQAVLQSIQRYFASDRRPSVREAFLYQQSSAEIPGLLESLRESGGLVELHWVPGHSGVIGNSRADRLARDAVEAVKPIMPYHCVSADGRDFKIIPVRDMVRERVSRETEQARAQVRSVIETQSSEYFREHQQQATTPEEILRLLDQIKLAVEGTIIQQHQKATQPQLTEPNRGYGAIDARATPEIPTPTTMITEPDIDSEPIESESIESESIESEHIGSESIGSEPTDSEPSESTGTQAEEVASVEPESPERRDSGTTMVASNTESTTLSDRPDSIALKPSSNKGRKHTMTRFKLKNTFRKVSGGIYKLAHGREGRAG